MRKNDDLISRQAAIDAVISLCDDCNTCYCGSCRINDPVDKDAKKVLEELPSAQPEIIRCKDCKWCENADGSMCKNPASWVVATDRDFGCVLAERRTDDQSK